MLRFLLFAAMGFGVAACGGRSVINVEPLGDAYDERRAALGRVDDWTMSGRIAVRTPDDGFSASLRWIQIEETFDARVNGPLGVGAIHLSGDLEQVRIEHGDGEIEVFQDPERSLTRRLGWTVPVASFRYWALGIEGPGPVDAISTDDSGRLARLRQQGWDVEYVEYQGDAGADLPRKLIADNGDVKLTVLIRRWDIPGPSVN